MDESHEKFLKSLFIANKMMEDKFIKTMAMKYEKEPKTLTKLALNAPNN